MRGTPSCRRFAMLVLVLPVRLAAQAVPLGDAFQVNVVTAGAQHNVRVSVADNDSFVFAWASADEDGDDLGIVARKFSSAGAPFSPFVLNQTVAADQKVPKLDMNGSGDYVVAFQSGPAGSQDLLFRGSTTNGAVLANEAPANSTSTVAIVNYSICRFPDGRIGAAWDHDGIKHRLFEANGTPITTEKTTNGSATARSPAVACLSSGDLLVAWRDDDDDGDGVHFRRFDAAGVGTGFQQNANADESGSQTAPRAAADGIGGFVVAWDDDTVAEPIHIELRRFRDDGTPVGGDLAPLGSEQLLLDDLDVASDGAIFVAFTDLGVPRVLELDRTGRALPGLADPTEEGFGSSTDVGAGLRTYVVGWDGGPELFARRYLRRAIFSDDFEWGDRSAWSSTGPP